MANDPFYRTWGARVVFFGLSFLLILIPLTPIDLSPTNWPRPDILFAVTFVVVLRRPDIAVFWLVALIFLFADILRSDPIGLWAAISLMGVEFARDNRVSIRENLFIGEWTSFVAIFTLCLIVKSVIETLFLIPKMGIINGMILIGVTTILYPITLLIVKYGFRIRRPRASDFDQGIQSL